MSVPTHPFRNPLRYYSTRYQTYAYVVTRLTWYGISDMYLPQPDLMVRYASKFQLTSDEDARLAQLNQASNEASCQEK